MWEMRPLERVATLQRGYDLPKQSRRGGGVPIYAANGVIGFHAEHQVVGPGVVTGRSGSIGKVHYSEGDFWPLNTSLFVKDFHGNDERYVYWLLRHMCLEQFHEGTGVPTLNRNVVHRELVPVPPLNEQRRIAAILDKADALRAKRREAIAKLDQLQESLFVDAMVDVSRWPTVPLSALCESDASITYGILQPGPDIEGGVLYVRPSEIKNGKIVVGSLRRTSASIAKKYAKSSLRPNDILITIVGTIGAVAVVPFELDGANITQSSARIRVCASKAEPSFVELFLRSPFAKRQYDSARLGVAVERLNLHHVRDLQMPVPPMNVQRVIAEKAKHIQALKAKFSRSIARTEMLNGALQSSLFESDAP